MVKPKVNPFLKADMAKDAKNGIKENSPKDKKMDMKSTKKK